MIPKKDEITRREMLAPAAAGLAFTIVPRHVLGGPGYAAPSDKITLAYIGCGTQGVRELLRLVATPDVQITAVCDPVKDGTNYVDWDKTGIRDSVRKLLENTNWGAGVSGIRAGRDMAKEIIDTYYAKKRGSENFRGVATYADFRELLEKEKDLDSVKIMTPDHLHATISIAAMKKHKHVLIHKPLSNRVAEVRMVVERRAEDGRRHASAGLAKRRYRGTGYDPGRRHRHAPGSPQLDGPPVLAAAARVSPPRGRRSPRASIGTCGWGPALDRPYHPSYTHAVFRGWYEFGGGSIADMGNYSLWPIFMALDLPVPYSIEAQSSSSGEINDQVSTVKMNDFAFPYANRVCFKFAAHGQWPAIKLYWYDGGMRPFTPDELLEDGKSIPATGTLFVGDKGVILNNEIVPAKKMQEYRAGKGIPQPQAGRGGRGGSGGGGETDWIAAFKGGPPSPGNFLNAANCSEAIALAGAAIRYSRKIFDESRCAPALLWDQETMKFTNIPDANTYLTREYRDGWKLTGA